MLRNKRILWLSLIALLVLLCVYVYIKVEWVEKTNDIGPRAEIKRQTFLAAQRFLAKNDLEMVVEKGYTRLDGRFSKQGFSQQQVSEDPIGSTDQAANSSKTKEFPSVHDSILIDDGYGSLSQNRADKLLEWVDAGGHLMLTANNPYLSSSEDRIDRVFESFGVSVIFDVASDYEITDEFDSSDSKDSSSPSQVSDGAELPDTMGKALEEELLNWHPTDRCDRMRDNVHMQVYESVDVTLGFRSYRALSFSEEAEDDFSYWASNSKGIQIIQRPYGEGLITFLSDMEAWKNDYIACYDNAYMLRFFVGKSDKVWLLENQDSPSILTLFWQKFPYFILLSAALIGLLLWRYGQRFGDIKASKSLSRRSIIEHIDASALFIWRKPDERWLLVDAVRQSIRKNMKLRHAHFDNKSPEQQWHLIAMATKLPIEEIQAVFSINENQSENSKAKVLTEQSFIVLISALKRIEEKL